MLRLILFFLGMPGLLSGQSTISFDFSLGNNTPQLLPYQANTGLLLYERTNVSTTMGLSYGGGIQFSFDRLFPFSVQCGLIYYWDACRKSYDERLLAPSTPTISGGPYTFYNVQTEVMEKRLFLNTPVSISLACFAQKKGFLGVGLEMVRFFRDYTRVVHSGELPFHYPEEGPVYASDVGFRKICFAGLKFNKHLAVIFQFKLNGPLEPYSLKYYDHQFEVILRAALYTIPRQTILLKGKPVLNFQR